MVQDTLIDVSRRDIRRVMSALRDRLGTFHLPSHEGIGVIENIRHQHPDIRVRYRMRDGLPFPTAFERDNLPLEVALTVALASGTTILSALADWSAPEPVIAHLNANNLWYHSDGTLTVHGFGMWAAWTDLASIGVVPPPTNVLPEGWSNGRAGPADTYALAAFLAEMVVPGLRRTSLAPPALRMRVLSHFDERGADEGREARRGMKALAGMLESAPGLAELFHSTPDPIGAPLSLQDVSARRTARSGTQLAQHQLGILLGIALEPEPAERVDLVTFLQGIAFIRDMLRPSNASGVPRRSGPWTPRDGSRFRLGFAPETSRTEFGPRHTSASNRPVWLANDTTCARRHSAAGQRVGEVSCV